MDSSLNDHQQVEAIDNLLEDFWFYDNLFDRRSRILRYCHSDPYPFSPSSSSSSSSSVHPKPKFPISEDSDSVTPTCTKTKEGESKAEKINKMTRQFSEKIRVTERRTYLRKKEPMVTREGFRKNRTVSQNNSVHSCSMGGRLQRTQTLPSYIGREDDRNEFQYQDIDDSRMGFLIREAIASSSPGFTPTKVSSIPRPRPPRNSRSEEAIQELVMLKDLDNESEKQGEEEKQRRIPRGSVKIRSAAVVGQPIPVWVAKDSARDMKAQIKFWARTVASNVRQEC